MQAAPIFSDGMVLQRDVRLKIWGKASPGEQLKARFRGEVYALQSSAQGAWILELPPQEAGGPFELVIEGQDSTLAIRDILVGDVWHLAGQSNMEMPIARTLDLYQEEVSGAENPLIRQFRVPIAFNFQGPQSDLAGGIWKALSPQTVLEFSALGYFFAQAYFARYRVPVGLVLTAVGGSHVEAWLSEETIQELGGFADVVQQFKVPGHMEQIIQRDLERQEKWYRELDARDLGRQPGQMPWSSPELDDSQWPELDVPGLWRRTELEELHGAVWLRKQVELDAEAASQEALLRLGTVVDGDETFINGVRVGKIDYKYPPRKYQVPEGVLKPGTNTIAVRVVINRSCGGFMPGKRCALEIGDRKINLAGKWKYRIGCRMETLPHSDRPHKHPSGMYNAMIAPLRGCAFRGVLWYQGESNAHAPEEYQRLFEALITSWRQDFADPGLPFFFVQLPNYDTASFEDGDPSKWAQVREAQLGALRLPDTRMAVTIDLGEANDLHPQNKKDIALRLLLGVRELVYGESVTAQGPLFERLERAGGALRIFFSGAEGGLVARDGEPKWFEVCGVDGIFHPAQAEIEGTAVRVWNPAVPEPTGVRYAWRDNPEGANLYNAEGLPASPFRAWI